MVNPAFPARQLVGVFSLELARQYGYLYQNTTKDFVILHSVDGFDEVSLTGPIKIFDNTGEKMVAPSDLDLPILRNEDILGGHTVEESARIFTAVLEGKSTPQQRDAVIGNAALGLYAANQKAGFGPAVASAREALESGKALSTFRKLIDSQD
jgi:anthranilate phosphoribosyltransferase